MVNLAPTSFSPFSRRSWIYRRDNHLLGIIKMDEIRTLFAIIAVVISFFSFYFTRRFWLESNRPIVTAEIVENDSGVDMALFDLIVHNSGSRPAINIRLSAEKENIVKIFSENIALEHKNAVYDVFSDNRKIALLLNGKEARTAFFSFCNNGDLALDILQYGAKLPVSIYYEDVEGRFYTSNVILFVRGSYGFGGSVWGRPKQKI